MGVVKIKGDEQVGSYRWWYYTVLFCILLEVPIIKRVFFQCPLRLLNEGASPAVPWKDDSDGGLERR